MTNIKTYSMWPDVLPEVLDYPSVKAILYLLELRKATYQGFAKIEEEKGFLKQEMELGTTEGQEAVRILTQRGLEEMVEAFESHNRDHYLEELVDAINYFWALIVIDPNAPVEFIANYLSESLCDMADFYNAANHLSVDDIGRTVVRMSPVLEKLRHRAWMHNPQSQYFDGWAELANFLGNNIVLVASQFRGWHEFCQYYIAKDNVLQFRIKSRY